MSSKFRDLLRKEILHASYADTKRTLEQSYEQFKQFSLQHQSQHLDERTISSFSNHAGSYKRSVTSSGPPSFLAFDCAEEPENYDTETDPITKDNCMDEEFLTIGEYEGAVVKLLLTNEMLGRGAFATVCRGTLFIENSEESFDVAIKEAITPCTARNLTQLLSLLEIRYSLRHRHLAETFCFHAYPVNFEEGPVVNKAIMALEISTYGSVARLLKEKERLREDEIQRIMKPVLACLQYLHLAGVVHNDVKPHNIFVFNEAEDDSDGTSWCFKLADLSSAQLSTPVDRLRWKLQYDEQLLEETSTANYCGTCTYMSPESCLGMSDSTANDVWSVGITIFQLATGQLPWTSVEGAFPCVIVSNYRSKYASGNVIPLASTTHSEEFEDYKEFGPIITELNSDAYSEELRQVVKWCLQEDLALRPTCADLLKHPFFSETGASNNSTVCTEDEDQSNCK